MLFHTHAVGGQERALRNPCEVAAPLLERHGLANLEEVPHHVAMALGTQAPRLRYGGFDFRRHRVCAGQEFLEAIGVFVDTAAHLPTVRLIGFVEFGNAGEFGVAKLEFLLKPGEFGGLLVENFAVRRGTEHVETAIGRCANDEAGQKDGEGRLHGSDVRLLIRVNGLHVAASEFVVQMRGMRPGLPITGSDAKREQHCHVRYSNGRARENSG